MVLKKNFFTNDRSVIVTTLRHIFSEKIVITAVNNGARTVLTTYSTATVYNLKGLTTKTFMQM